MNENKKKHLSNKKKRKKKKKKKIGLGWGDPGNYAVGSGTGFDGGGGAMGESLLRAYMREILSTKD